MANAAVLCGCPVQQSRPKNVASRATLIGPTTTKLKFRFKPSTVGIFQSRKLQSFDRINLAMAASSSSFPSQDPITGGSFSPAERVEQLYKCINEKNLKGLEEIVSEECCIEDFSFPKPFEGKKEVLKFFEQLTISMGKNVKFKIQKAEEDEVTSWVYWRLEWKDRPIPFTRGCSFFEFSKDGQTLNIRKAQVFIESPIKPGSLVLVLLKTVTTLFDEYPQAAEWFLKSQHTVGQWVHQIYAILVAPIAKPIVESYINFWKFTAWVLAYAINIVIFLTKIFFN